LAILAEAYLLISGAIMTPGDVNNDFRHKEMSMDYKAVALSCITYIMAAWMLLHGIRGAQTGVIVESRKGSSVKDYYYRGDVGFYVNVFLYITGGTATVGFSTWLLMRGLGYW
jgi:hypothetical protein